MSASNELQGATTRAVAVLELAHAAFRAANARPELTFQQLLTLNFLARGMTTHRAVRLLVENGLNGEAAATMRTLVELDIDLAFILIKDTDVRFERFFDYEHVVMHRILEENPDSMSEEKAQGVRQRYAAVRQNYPNPYRWIDLSIKKRADAANRSSSYKTAYALGSGASHAGLGSLKYSVGSSADEITLYVESREPHPALLEFSSNSLWRLTHSVASHLRLGIDDDLERVAKLLEAATHPGG